MNYYHRSSESYYRQAMEAMQNRKPPEEVMDRLLPLPVSWPVEDYKNIRDYDFCNVRGHIEVFKHGEFQYSADTEQEARYIFYHEDF